MTTEVIVKANHGWPVSVAAVDPLDPSELARGADPVIVEAGETRAFFVHSGQDLLIHEIQPAEADA